MKPAGRDGSSAITDAFAAFKSGTDFGMGFPALKFHVRIDVGIFVS